MIVAVKKYWTESGKPTRFHGVYVDGELLCVTVYRKGARAVKALLDALSGADADAVVARLRAAQDAEERVREQRAQLRKLRRQFNEVVRL